jgi:hypothetical protein
MQWSPKRLQRNSPISSEVQEPGSGFQQDGYQAGQQPAEKHTSPVNLSHSYLLRHFKRFSSLLSVFLLWPVGIFLESLHRA